MQSMKQWTKRIMLTIILCTALLAGCETATTPSASSDTPPHSATPDISPLPTVNNPKPVHLYQPLIGLVSLENESELTTRIPLLTGTGIGYFLNSEQGDFSEIRTDSGEGGWIPTWYLNEASAHIRNVEPQMLLIVKDTDALWFPDGREPAASLKAGEHVYTYQEYEEWYGVVAIRKDESLRPFMTWIPKASAETSGPAPNWFDKDADEETAMRVLATAVPSLLVPGTTRERVRELFGEPAYIEQSSNKGETGDKPFTLPAWRYESRALQLVIQWNQAGVLESAYYRDADTLFNLGPWAGPAAGVAYLVPSIVPEWEWRYPSDLPYNFLIDTIGDALIIAGEDGGFSGMHMKSILYALHKGTGKRIWQYDFGPHATMYGMSKDKRMMAVLKQDFDRKSGAIPYVLETIYTQTGKQVWQRKMDDVNVLGLAVTGNVAVVLYADMLNGSVTDNHSIQAWDIRTGKTLWTKKLPDYKNISTMYNTSNPELVILQAYRDGYDPEGGDVIALDPKTGKEQWKLEKRNTSMFYLLEDPNRLTESTGRIWTSTRDHLWLTDVRTGEDIAHYPIREESRYEVVDDRYLLSTVTERTGDERTYHYSLIDRKTGETLFTEPGYASFGTIIGDKLYYRLHNQTYSFDLNTKKITGHEYQANYYDPGPTIAYGDFLVSAYSVNGAVYVLDPESLEPIGRLLDTRVGLYDITPSQFLKGYLTDIDGSLYVGSANGWFSKMKSLTLQASP